MWSRLNSSDHLHATRSLKAAATFTGGISAPISRHNKDTDTVWHSQMSNLLQLKWDSADINKCFKKSVQDWSPDFSHSLLELGFKCSDQPNHDAFFFFFLLPSVEWWGRPWLVDPYTDLKSPCPQLLIPSPYTDPTVVPTEVFVQLHDEKHQGTDPVKE